MDRSQQKKGDLSIAVFAEWHIKTRHHFDGGHHLDLFDHTLQTPLPRLPVSSEVSCP